MKEKGAVGWAVLAAALYAVSTPVSKLLLREVAPAMLAALLYLGAGIGMLGLGMARGRRGSMRRGRRLDRRDLPYTAGMVVLDIAAPLCLMVGLTRTTSANASLLNNFEIVSTALIALLIFKERIGPRLWLAIGLITGACMLLSFEDGSSLQFSSGSLFVLLACICWGLENNCTRMISQCDPLEIVVIKGFGSGIGSLGIALAMGQQIPAPRSLLAALLLGFVAYGLSIFFYVYAQRTLGAAKTSAYYAVSPFLGTALSLAIFRTLPPPCSGCLWPAWLWAPTWHRSERVAGDCPWGHSRAARGWGGQSARPSGAGDCTSGFAQQNGKRELAKRQGIARGATAERREDGEGNPPAPVGRATARAVLRSKMASASLPSGRGVFARRSRRPLGGLQARQFAERTRSCGCRPHAACIRRSPFLLRSNVAPRVEPHSPCCSSPRCIPFLY